MTVKVSKPEFNLRSKLNELGGIVSPDRMPTGSVIQTQNYSTSTQATNNSNSSYVSIGLFVKITPLIVGSTLEVSACIPSYSNNTHANDWSNSFWLALYHTSPDNQTERRIALFEHPGPKTSMEFAKIDNPVFYMTAHHPGEYLFNWRVKLTGGADTHYFGRSTDGMNCTYNTVVREIKQ